MRHNVQGCERGAGMVRGMRVGCMCNCAPIHRPQRCPKVVHPMQASRSLGSFDLSASR